MGRKNNNAGQLNRQAQMNRRERRREANAAFKGYRTREESMKMHPAGKGLVR